MEQLKLEFNSDIDYMKILEEDDDCSIVQLDLLHLETNRNKTNISKECVERSLNSFYNKPIIYMLNNKLFPASSTDVVEHARTEDQEKHIYIGGTIPESSPVEYVMRNGLTYLRMTGVVYKLYQQTLYSILKNRKGQLKVSIEILPVDAEKGEDGILYIKEFKFLSVCLLGEGIEEGILGSQLVVTKFSLNDYAQHYLNFSNRNQIEIPETVKNNAIKGINTREKLGYSGTSASVSIADYLSANKFISIDKIKILNTYFKKHDYENINKENSKYVSWLLNGGSEGRNWTKEVMTKLDNVEETKDISVKKDGDKMTNNKANKYSLTFGQVREIISNAFAEFKYQCGDYEYRKYWVCDFNNEFAYVYDEEEGKDFSVPYVIENDVATIDITKKTEVISGGWKTVGESDPEVQVNAEQNEDPENEPEEEDYKAKFEAIEKECNELKESLAKYQRKDEEEKMSAYLEQYSHCYSEDELKNAKSEIEKESFEDFSKSVDEKAKAFALSMKNASAEEGKPKDKPEENDVKKNSLTFSVSPFGVIPSYDFSKNSNDKDLNSIIENSGVKF